LAIGFIEDRDHQLVLGTEVVVDERVVHPRVTGDFAYAQRRVAFLREAAIRRVEDLRFGVVRIRVGKQAGAACNACSTWP
jgi:hypothetical protein